MWATCPAFTEKKCLAIQEISKWWNHVIRLHVNMCETCAGDWLSVWGNVCLRGCNGVKLYMTAQQYMGGLEWNTDDATSNFFELVTMATTKPCVGGYLMWKEGGWYFGKEWGRCQHLQIDMSKLWTHHVRFSQSSLGGNFYTGIFFSACQSLRFFCSLLQDLLTCFDISAGTTTK